MAAADGSIMIFSSFLLLLLISASFLIVVVVASSSSDNNNSTSPIIDIDWKFDHILVLPVGCLWARNLTWRVRINCPAGQFFVTTRLQASTNQSFYCSDNFDESFFSTTFAHQLNVSDLRLVEKARQIAAREYGDGQSQRYDSPYPPIYGRGNNYWNCVGTNQGCSFLVRAADYTNQAASYNSKLAGEPPIATLVLPGPYCSTVDSFDYFERSGGTVYRTAYPPVATNATMARIDRLYYENHVANSSSSFNVNQSENVYLVTRCDSKTGKRRLAKCDASLLVRDMKLAQTFWDKNRFDFVKSILANIHVFFIELQHGNNYSTFYDDMTSSQTAALVQNLFTVDTYDNATGIVNLTINFNVERQTKSGTNLSLRIGLALYEFLIVGDQTAKMMSTMWPYRYLSTNSQRGLALLLLRNVTIDNCQLETTVDKQQQQQRKKFTTMTSIIVTNFSNKGDNDDDDDEWLILTPPTPTTTTTTITTTVTISGQEQQKAVAMSRQQQEHESKDCDWCFWSLWLVMAGLVLGMVLGSIGVLYFCTR